MLKEFFSFTWLSEDSSRRTDNDRGMPTISPGDPRYRFIRVEGGSLAFGGGCSAYPGRTRETSRPEEVMYSGYKTGFVEGFCQLIVRAALARPMGRRARPGWIMLIGYLKEPVTRET